MQRKFETTHEAQNIHENTIREAQNIRVQAQLDAKLHVDETIMKLNAAILEYDKLIRDKNTFLWKIRSALEAELAVITQLQNSLPSLMELEATKIITKKVIQDLKPQEPAAAATSAAISKGDEPTVVIPKVEKSDSKKSSSEKVKIEKSTDEKATAESKSEKKK